MSRFLKNVWYQAGWSRELDDAGQIARTIIGQPVLVFRNADGTPAAVVDRCPHRLAPLSAGRIADGVVTCGYHGLGFSGSGTCVRNPHGPITSALHIAAYPTVERHRAIWVWLGDAAKADPALIPDLGFIDQTPESAQVTLAMPTAADYRLLVDNIMDLSHADFLHSTTIGGIMVEARKASRVEDGKVIATWDARDCVPPPAFRPMVHPAECADIWTEVTWHAPAAMVLGTSAVPAGQTQAPGDIAWTLHNMTPESATTTHYFICSTRPFLLDDAEFSQMLNKALRQAFEDEDKPMLQRQQLSIGNNDIDDLNPVLLPIDAAAVRVRRQLAALLAAEAQ